MLTSTYSFTFFLSSFFNPEFPSGRWKDLNMRGQKLGFPNGSADKESACNAGDKGDAGSFSESGRSLGGGNGNPLQYSCLRNSMDRGVWRAVVQSITKSQM